MWRRSPIAVAAIVLMAACTEQRGAVYQVPLAKARQILMATGLPTLVFGSQPPEWEVWVDGGSDVIWIAQSDGAELFRYVAHLSEEGDGATRVRVELTGAEDSPAGNIAERLADHPEIRDMYLVAMNEQVASAIEHRPFDMSRLYLAMTAATVANIGSIQSSVDEAAAASERLARENIEKAYRDEAYGALP